MTIVCAYRLPSGETWLGSDTRVSSEGFIYPERAVKWQRFGKWALTLTGPKASHELALRYAAEVRDCVHPRGVSGVLMGACKASDWETLENKGGSPVYATNGILVSVEGIWLLSGNGCVSAPAWGFLASGSGEDFAYGAAHALLQDAESHGGDVVVRRAVEAAIAFRSDCGGDVVVERFE